MHKWLIWSGYALVALGAALLSPLADLLPVEVLPYLSGHFGQSGSQYLRVVPTGGNTPSLLAFVLLATGAAIAAIGWFFRRRAQAR